MRAAVMSGVDPGSTSETHSGVPSGADRNCDKSAGDHWIDDALTSASSDRYGIFDAV